MPVWQTEAHTITATAGEGGTVDPSGEVVVVEGADKTFTITPDNGYEIAEAVVDGQAVDLADVVNEDGTGTYTFEKVDGDHSIEITFEKTAVTPDPGEDEPDNPADDPNTPSGEDEPDNPADNPNTPSGEDEPDNPADNPNTPSGGDDQQGSSDAGQTDDGVKTGDETPIMLLTLVLVASGVAFVVLLRKSKRR